MMFAVNYYPHDRKPWGPHVLYNGFLSARANAGPNWKMCTNVLVRIGVDLWPFFNIDTEPCVHFMLSLSWPIKSDQKERRRSGFIDIRIGVLALTADMSQHDAPV